MARRAHWSSGFADGKGPTGTPPGIARWTGENPGVRALVMGLRGPEEWYAPAHAARCAAPRRRDHHFHAGDSAWTHTRAVSLGVRCAERTRHSCSTPNCVSVASECASHPNRLAAHHHDNQWFTHKWMALRMIIPSFMAGANSNGGINFGAFDLSRPSA